MLDRIDMETRYNYDAKVMLLRLLLLLPLLRWNNVFNTV